MLDYVAEFHLIKTLTSVCPAIKDMGKSDDHSRANKGDRIIKYRGIEIKVESKSLQTNSIQQLFDEKTGKKIWTGKTQVDASDRRTVRFPNGTTLETTCLKCGEFDLLAVNCFEFEKRWHFAFAKNSDLPHSTYKKYSTYQRKHLLATLVPVTWPPQPPFYSDPIVVLKSIIKERR